MHNELINEGLTLMVAGMGTVFVFLTALVFAMNLMSRLVVAFQPAADETGPGNEEIAAITAAIAEHRRK